ncbi:MAG TPA: YggT family protein [Acidimicrobiales bacterium]|nr:YggT family protein [Acidimicrobiales bacterium]
MFWVDRPFYTIGYIYLLVMILWAVLSWFPVDPGSPVSKFRHSLGVLVQPVVAPFRRFIPPAGMFDMSYMVAFIVVLLLNEFVFYRIVI